MGIFGVGRNSALTFLALRVCMTTEATQNTSKHLQWTTENAKWHRASIRRLNFQMDGSLAKRYNGLSELHLLRWFSAPVYTPTLELGEGILFSAHTVVRVTEKKQRVYLENTQMWLWQRMQTVPSLIKIVYTEVITTLFPSLWRNEVWQVWYKLPKTWLGLLHMLDSVDPTLCCQPPRPSAVQNEDYTTAKGPVVKGKGCL